MVRGRGLIAACAASAALLAGAVPALAQAPAEPPTPELIEQALDRGQIGLETANLYRVYALKGDPRLPAAFESDTPFDGTLLLRRARQDVKRMRPGSVRERVTQALAPPPPDPNLTHCDVLSVSPLPNSTTTEHFYIQYNAATLHPSLTIDDYKESLEQAWLTQIDDFGWAAPPVYPDNPAPDGKYHVRIDAMGPVLYGFVSSVGTYAGPADDNPNTTWDDEDADASCMGLNQDYDPFPGTPRQALDATTAHEFHHSIQFGYGALNGSNTPDDHVVEGGATWMEDENQDAADDNYNYLWPEFDDSMGEHEGDVYSYWITWRGLTERFGTTIAGGGEQLMQDFWEITSRNEGDSLGALQTVLGSRGLTLGGAFHAYAIAVKFNRACGGGYTLPHCFEEGPGYVAAAGPTEPHGSLAGSDPSFDGELEDNYALNWVTLPRSEPYSVTLSNESSGGSFRGTVACDTGSGLRLAPMPAAVGGGASATVGRFDPSGCLSAYVVVTNQTQTAANPDDSEPRPFSLALGPPEPPAERASDETGGSAGAAPPPPAGQPGQPATGSGNDAGSSERARDRTRPRLGRPRLSRSRFRAARSGPSIAARLGTRVRYSLSERASVSVTFRRAVRTRSGRLRWRRVRGRLRMSGREGRNAFVFRGRVSRRTLRSGLYRMTIRPRDRAGNSGRSRTVRFRIVR